MHGQLHLRFFFKNVKMAHIEIESHVNKFTKKIDHKVKHVSCRYLFKIMYNIKFFIAYILFIQFCGELLQLFKKVYSFIFSLFTSSEGKIKYLVIDVQKSDSKFCYN